MADSVDSLPPRRRCLSSRTLFLANVRNASLYARFFSTRLSLSRNNARRDGRKFTQTGWQRGGGLKRWYGRGALQRRAPGKI